MFFGEFFSFARGQAEVILGDSEIVTICRSRYHPAGQTVAESLNVKV